MRSYRRQAAHLQFLSEVTNSSHCALLFRGKLLLPFAAWNKIKTVCLAALSTAAFLLNFWQSSCSRGVCCAVKPHQKPQILPNHEDDTFKNDFELYLLLYCFIRAVDENISCAEFLKCRRDGRCTKERCCFLQRLLGALGASPLLYGQAVK